MSNENLPYMKKSDRPPPMSVVVVRKESEGGINTNDNSTTHSSSCTSSSFSSTSRQRNMGIPAAFSEPFRLQPRKPILSKPLAGSYQRDGSGDIRGRKRTAQSMSISVSDSPAVASTTTGSSSWADESFSMPMSTIPVSTPTSCAVDKRNASQEAVRTGITNGTASSQSENGGTMFSTPPYLPSTPNSSLNKTLESLSIKGAPQSLFSKDPPQRVLNKQYPPLLVSAATPSVCGADTTTTMTTTTRQTIQGGSSSFTAYHTNSNNASPVGSLRSVGAGSIGSAPCTRMAGTPASTASTVCSPKIAPLTVLTNHGPPHHDGGAYHVSCSNNNRTPQRTRPPLHGGMSSMLFSLDSTSRTACHHSNRPSHSNHETEFDALTTPRLPPSTVHCRRPSEDDTLSTVHDNDSYMLTSPAADVQTSSKRFVPSSDRSDFSTPSKRSRSGSSPRTPLPKITLTPRSTGSRHSANSNNNKKLPSFPSPSQDDDDDDMLLISPPFIRNRSSNNTRQGGGPPGIVIAQNSQKDSQDTNHSFCAIPGGSSNVHQRKLSYLPSSSSSSAAKRSLFPQLAGGGKSVSPFATTSSPSASLKRKDCATTTTAKCTTTPLTAITDSMDGPGSHQSSSASTTTNINNSNPSSKVVANADKYFPKVKTISLLTPPQFEGWGVLQSLVENDGRSSGETAGSMSDIDDDEAFVLTAPKTLEEERLAKSQRSKQQRRRRSSSSNNNNNTWNSSAGACWSSTSLASSYRGESNTSLVGMNILRTPEKAAPTPLVGTATAGRAGIAIPELGGSTIMGGMSHLRKSRMSESSLASIGLAIETADVDCCASRTNNEEEEDKKFPPLAEDDNNQGRDLVTPPPMVDNKTVPSCPPLTPDKEARYGKHFVSKMHDQHPNPTSPPVVRMDGGRHIPKPSPNLFISGADSLSVSRTIASIALKAEPTKGSPRVRAA